MISNTKIIVKIESNGDSRSASKLMEVDCSVLPQDFQKIIMKAELNCSIVFSKAYQIENNNIVKERVVWIVNK
jgi:hypothetical protein